LTTPTRFEFDAASYGRERNKQEIVVGAAIAPNVPEEAVKRGAAVVKLTILKSGRAVADVVIRVGAPFRKTLPVPPNGNYEFVVDNYNGPDTDWLLLSIQ
jgi:hypothetical protein